MSRATSIRDNAEPLLEADRTMQSRATVGITLAKYSKFLGNLFSDAAGVVLGWQWSRVLHAYIDELEVKTEFNNGRKVGIDMKELSPDAFGVVYALLLTALAAFLVTQAQTIKHLPKSSFVASCRMLLLVVMPMLLGWAWKDCLRQLFWEHLEASDEVLLFLTRVGFALTATLIVVLLTRIVNSSTSEQYVQGSDADSSSGMGALDSADDNRARVWNMILMVCKSFAVFLSWCWHAVAREFGLLFQGTIGKDSSTLWTRGIYAGLVTTFFTFTTIRLVNQFKVEEALEEHQEGQPIDPGLRNYKQTWKQYFKLIGSTKGYMIGWAWSEFFESLLIGRSFNRIHVDYSIYTLIVVLMGMLLTTHMAYIDGRVPEGSLILVLNRILLHVAGMMAGWAIEAWLQTAIPDDHGPKRLGKAVVITVLACLVYHLIRRNMTPKPPSEEAQQLEAEEIKVEMEGKVTTVM